MPWPAHARLLALDSHRGMIHGVWPRTARIDSFAACADWTRMPVRDAHCEMVVSDCCYSSLDFPAGYALLTAELHRVLVNRGLFAMRVFLRPGQSETLARIFDDLNRGRIGSFHAFKWRLAMALHRDLAAGVRLADIWNAWREVVPKPGLLARKLGWPIEAIQTIEAYRGLETRYTFPTLEELQRTLSVCFSQRACVYPEYELGERCPTLLFEPK